MSMPRGGSAVPTSAKRDAASSPASHAKESNSHRSKKVVHVLVVSPFDEDHVFLNYILGHSNWEIHAARSCREALEILRQSPIPVVICESEMAEITWKDLLAELGQLQEPPLLIVTSRLADESLWAEVLNLGGYDVLMKPFDRTEVVRTISLAWMHWRNTWERAGGTDRLASAVSF
jgi:DNA-binding response OmpR family regulator